ncbi:MAG: UpxY family transcription antiterminator [Bacteroidales bacterium]|nr:UpxY family transcription antiterminator [Bacteroidales bacterium]
MVGKEYYWYVVYVTRHHEKRSLLHAENIGVDALLPINYITRQWSDRIKLVEEPMFPSYLFVRTSCLEYFEVLKSPSIIEYVCFKGEPARVPQCQINAIREICNRTYSAEASLSPLIAGESVIVSRGPLRGTRGELISNGGMSKKIRISIEAIGYSLVISLPEDHLLRLPDQKQQVFHINPY